MNHCLICNKEIKDYRKVCSRACFGKYYTQNHTGWYHSEEAIQKFKNRRWGPERKTGSIVSCSICNTSFYRKKSHMFKKEKAILRFYCSETCRILGLKSFGSWSKDLHCHNDERVKRNHINIHISVNKRPNIAESKLDTILQKSFPNEWKYVGDGSFLIEGYSPDFVNINGKKQIIEMFGDYWHRGQNPQNRINLFKRYGYECIVIWENELKDQSSVVQRVRSL